MGGGGEGGENKMKGESGQEAYFQSVLFLFNREASLSLKKHNCHFIMLVT